jgi:hypothetical protein
MLTIDKNQSAKPKGKSMADYARMEKTTKAGKMGLYGGNKPKTSESSESRLGSSPSRLPAKNQPATAPADVGADALSGDLMPQTSQPPTAHRDLKIPLQKSSRDISLTMPLNRINVAACFFSS